MRKKLKHKRNTSFRSVVKRNRKKLFIKDIKRSKFKKRRNKSILKFLQLFDLKIDKNNVVYLYIWIVLLLLWVVWFIVFGPYFQIKTINIVRQDNLSNINIAYKALENVRGTHIMFNDSSTVESYIKSYQENIESVSVNRKLPNKLDVLIGSYEPVFNTNIKWKNYIITKNGSFIPEKANSELKNLTIISEKPLSSIPDYKKIISVEHMEKIESIYKEIQTNIIRIQIKDIIYYPTEREVIIDIQWNTKLIFDLEKTVWVQVKRLAIFDTENIKIDAAELLYIDLRISNKVFYCTTETEYQCVTNLKNIYPENID